MVGLKKINYVLPNLLIACLIIIFRNNLLQIIHIKKKFIMKRTILSAALTASIFLSCSKANTTEDATTVTASTTQAAVGQAVALTVSTPSNAVSWTVTPSASAISQYTITTAKTNTVSFTQPGLYVVGVR